MTQHSSHPAVGETAPLAHRPVEIFVNASPVQVAAEVTGAAIKAAARVPADFQLFRIAGRREIRVADDERLHVHPGERFLAAPSLDPSLTAHPAHAEALRSVYAAFPDHCVEAAEDAQGATLVTVREVEIGTGWAPPVIDLEVKLQVTFPTTAPYPYYGPAGLRRTDGRAFAPVQPAVVLDGVPRAQISLNRPFDPTVETLGARLVAVVAWLRDPR